MRNLSILTNEQLVKSLQQEMQDTLFLELFHRFVPLFRKYSQRYVIEHYDLEDYYQEGRIVLYNAIYIFDEDRGYYFASLFNMMYKNQLYNELRKSVAKKRRHHLTDVSYEYVDATGGGYDVVPFISMVADSNVCSPEDVLVVRDISSRYLYELSSFESKVFCHHLLSLDFDETAYRLGVSSKRVRNAYDRCRQKLRRYCIE